MKPKVEIYNLLRLDEVKRWHTICVGREQTVAGHSHRVTTLAIEIAHRAGIEITADFICAAMFHDAAEDIFGDIPAPAKTEYGAYAEPEFSIEPHFNMQPSNLSREHWMAIKVADLLESWLFLYENAVGSHSIKCMSRLGKKVAAFVVSCGIHSAVDYEGITSKLCMELVGNTYLFSTEAEDD